MTASLGKIDLHLHTLKSDGRLSSTELVHLAHARGVRWMALTDHDTTAGVRDAQARGAELVEQRPRDGAADLHRADRDEHQQRRRHPVEPGVGHGEDLRDGVQGRTSRTPRR